ncbi:MAG: hypothetical protein IIW94_02660 [Clostridia bacterium]|nr:hypothetical protein [Clostridia bacterium]
MRKFLILLIVILCSISFSGCSSNDVTIGSEGLEFYPLSNGTYAVGGGTSIYLDEIVIPSKHEGKAVTEIAEYAFSVGNNHTLSCVIIPNTIKKLNYGSFCCGTLISIEYDGTIKEWEKINKDENWNLGLYNDEKALTVHCKDGNINPKCMLEF